MSYLFLNSYLDAREKHIANDVDFERMINEKNRSACMKVLQDTDYGIHALDKDDLDEILFSEKVSFRKDLIKLGFSQVAQLFLLREDISDFRSALKEDVFEVNSKISEGRKRDLYEKFKEELAEAKRKSSPAELDDYLTEVFLERLKKFVKGDKESEKFIEKYKKLLWENREKELIQLEKDFVINNRKKNESISPVLAYLMQKWRAEKVIRSIVLSKELGFSTSRIQELTNQVRAL